MEVVAGYFHRRIMGAIMKRLEDGIIDQLNEVSDARVREKRELDKRTFYLIVSLFGFSMVFVQFIEQTKHMDILLWSWLLNVLALASHYMAYIFVDLDLQHKRKLVYECTGNLEEIRELLIGVKTTWRGAWSERFDQFSYVFLLLAVGLLLIFAFLNF